MAKGIEMNTIENKTSGTFDKVEFGLVVATERNRHKWTQDDLAKIVRDLGGVQTSKSAIGRIENGQIDRMRKADKIFTKLALLFPGAAKYLDEHVCIPKKETNSEWWGCESTQSSIKRHRIGRYEKKRPLWKRILLWKVW